MELRRSYGGMELINSLRSSSSSAGNREIKAQGITPSCGSPMPTSSAAVAKIAAELCRR